MSVSKTIAWGDIQATVLERDWRRTKKMLPYRKTYLLKPGQSWRDAPYDPASSLSEHYVQLEKEAIPAGALIAKEMAEEGAVVAVWTECYGRGRAVFMSPELECVSLTGEIADILQRIRAANDNRWAGLPDAVAIFSDGRVAFRDAKVAGKDRLSTTQKEFARVACTLLGNRADFGVVEWGQKVAE